MFDTTFDTILNDILTDHVNQDATVDVSKGSPDYVVAAAVGSAVWGLEKRGKYLSTQIIPGPNMSRENLEHHATLRGLPLIPDENDAELLDRLLFDIRHPPAGGNDYDYIRWAKEASALVVQCWPVSLGQGPGTTDLILLADAAATGSEIPTNELCALVRAYIVAICPNDVKYLRVLAPEVVNVDVAITLSGTDYPAAQAVADITGSLNGYIPGQTLYRDSLKVLALGGGNGEADVSDPTDNTAVTPYQMIRPGDINVA